MKTQEQIDASIAAIEPAPVGETLHQIAVRLSHWLLGTLEDGHEAIGVTRQLYGRVIAGDQPSEAEWQQNIDNLDLALDLDLDLALDLARALDVLLGDRLETIEHLDRVVLAAIEHNGNALDMSCYHKCRTTHCRSGWSITVHPIGQQLETAFGPWLAGAVIYLRSTGRVPDFFCSDEAALADIRHWAGC